MLEGEEDRDDSEFDGTQDGEDIEIPIERKRIEVIGDGVKIIELEKGIGLLEIKRNIGLDIAKEINRIAIEYLNLVSEPTILVGVVTPEVAPENEALILRYINDSPNNLVVNYLGHKNLLGVAFDQNFSTMMNLIGLAANVFYHNVLLCDGLTGIFDALRKLSDNKVDISFLEDPKKESVQKLRSYFK